MKKRERRFETLDDIEHAFQSRLEKETKKRPEKRSGNAAPKGVSGENSGEDDELIEDLTDLLDEPENAQDRSQENTQEKRLTDTAEERRTKSAAHRQTGIVHGRKSAQKDFSQEEKLLEYGRLLVIPLIAVILMAVILVLDKSPETDPGAAASQTESEAESQSVSGAETGASDEDALQICEIPEIRMLISDYFDARLAADTDRLYEIFGRKDDSRKEKVASMLKTQAAWIQAFQNIEIYALPGKENDARLCIVTYDIDFRRTDTLAPGIMYSYVQRDADGKYIIAENLRKETRDYINEKLEEKPVKELRTKINNELQNALAKDGTLALIYTSFNNGEIYSETNLEEDDEPEVNLLTPENSDLAGGLSDRVDAVNEADASKAAENDARLEEEAGDPAEDADTQADGEAAMAPAKSDTAENAAGSNGAAGAENETAQAGAGSDVLLQIDSGD